MICYADHDFYTDVFKGTIGTDEFNKCIGKASAYIRKITFERADAYTDDDAVQLAACAVCELYAADEKRRAKHQGLTVVSENTDGYSVSYVQEQSSGETAEDLLARKAYRAAAVYLPEKLLSWEV